MKRDENVRDPTVSENANIRRALEYHEATKHSEISVRTGGYSMDWHNRPLPYKVYANLTRIKLPQEFPSPVADTVASVAAYGPKALANTIDMKRVAEVLYYSAGITKTIRYGGELFRFRAAASTGALYEIEVYVVVNEVDDLESGVYHFNPEDFTLTQLRTGDYRLFLAAAAENRGDVLSAPLTLILSATYWRNAWKYRARCYRHFFWNAGTILANLLALAVSEGFIGTVLLGFIDSDVNHQLGLNIRHEAALALIPLRQAGSKPSSVVAQRIEIPSITHYHFASSKKEVEYPEVLRVHQASSLRTAAEVTAWTAKAISSTHRWEGGTVLPLVPLQSHSPSPLGQTIVRRGSTRRFSREPIPYPILSTILQSSTNGIPADFLNRGSTLIEIYLIINAVKEVEPGAYYYDRENQQLRLLKAGNFREIAGYLCLEQTLAADGSVTVFLMTALEGVLKRYGNRGYRAAQLEAGTILGKMNLSAFGLGIGATGITFYDDAVTNFFSPHAADNSNMVTVVLGVPAYGRRPEPVLA